MWEFLTKLLEKPLWFIFLFIGSITFLASLVSNESRLGKLFDDSKTRKLARRAGIFFFVIGVLGYLVPNGAIAWPPGPNGTPIVTSTTSTAQNESSTPNSTSTSSRKEWAVNRLLSCIDYCTLGSDPRDNFVEHIDVQITVTSFTFDTTQKETSMHLLFDSHSNNSGCSFGDGFSFQDERGKTYPPGGAFKDGGSFSLAKQKQQKFIALYSFLPSSGSTYTLRPGTLYCEGHSFGYTPIYEDTQFEFPS